MRFFVQANVNSAKELDNSNFFREVPAILRHYKWMYLTVITVLTAAIVCQTHVLPYHWVVRRFPAIFPLFYNLGCHLLVPFILNPEVMVRMYCSSRNLAKMFRNFASRLETATCTSA